VLLFGAAFEAPAGLVVDTFGLPGARVGTWLRWDRSVFVDSLALRPPSVLVLAYGTNEVGDDHDPVHRHAERLTEALRLARRAAPEASCLVLGPTDRTGPGARRRPRQVEVIRVHEEVAKRSGCAFLDLVGAMGGEGSMPRWVASGLANADHVHLTPEGYERLARDAAGILLGILEARRGPEAPQADRAVLSAPGAPVGPAVAGEPFVLAAAGAPAFRLPGVLDPEAAAALSRRLRRFDALRQDAPRAAPAPRAAVPLPAWEKDRASGTGGLDSWTRMVSRHDGVVVRNPDRAWGRREVVDLVDRCAAGVRKRQDRSAGPLFVADWSCRRGGGPCAPHRSHRTGLDVDLGYLVQPEAFRPALHRPRARDLAVDAQLELLGCLVRSGTVEVVFTDRRWIALLEPRATATLGARLGRDVMRVLRHLRGHADHLHVRFRSPDALRLAGP
jgi:lysophospholipase L1-like esterase